MKRTAEHEQLIDDLVEKGLDRPTAEMVTDTVMTHMVAALIDKAAEHVSARLTGRFHPGGLASPSGGNDAVLTDMTQMISDREFVVPRGSGRFRHAARSIRGRARG